MPFYFKGDIMTDIIRKQLKLYPKAELRDIIKALYQSVFGCGHFVKDGNACRELLIKELKGISKKAELTVENFGKYSRVHLSSLEEMGIESEMLLRLFALSAEAEGDKSEFAQMLKALPKLCEEGKLPFDAEQAEREINEYIGRGCPALSHSESFRCEYSPAYRVVKSEYLSLLPLLKRIDSLLCQKQNVIVAIDGCCASGKTTLASFLEKYYRINAVHMDDYFLQPEKKTPERLSMAGGNIDHERFLSELLLPLSKGEEYLYRPYRCHGEYFEEGRVQSPEGLTLVEGSYSLHPELESYYDLKVYLSVPPKIQIARLEKRSPEMLHRFINEWIPLEMTYFEKTDILNRCDMRLISTENNLYEVLS